MFGRPNHREDDEPGKSTRDDAVAVIAVSTGSVAAVFALLLAPLSTGLAASAVSITTLIAIWLIARRPPRLTRWVQHASAVQFRWIAIAALLILVSASAGPALVYAHQLAAVRQEAAAKFDPAAVAAVGVTNITRGDARYVGSVDADVGDTIRVQFYVRNMSVSDPLDGAKLYWWCEEAGPSVWVVHARVALRDSTSVEEAAAIVLTSRTSDVTGTLAPQAGGPVVLRSMNTSNQWTDSTLLSSSEMEGDVELPSISSKIPGDEVTVTILLTHRGSA